MDADLVSFIIPAHTKHPYLVACLDAIKRQQLSSFRTEIILVDNSPTGLELAVGGVILTRCLTPGASRARNAGLAEAKGRWVAFVDSDTVLQDHWLDGLLPRLISCKASAGQGQIRTVGATPYGHYHQFRLLQDKHGQQGLLASEWVLPSLNTSACIIDRSAYPHLYFDTNIPYAEDVELSWRLIHYGNSRWYFSRDAEAVSFEPSESFMRFWGRNFNIAKMMKRLTLEYSVPSLDLLQNEFFQTERWIKSEIKKSLETFSVAQIFRLVSAISFYCGLIAGQGPIKRATNTSGTFTVLYEDTLRTIDLTTYQARITAW